MAEIPSSAFIAEDPGGTYPSGPRPTDVIPGSNAMENLGLRQRTLPAPQMSQNWQDKLGQLLQLAAAGLGDVYRPPGMKTNAAMKEIEQMRTLRDEKAARQAMGYVARLQAFAMSNPAQAQDAMLDLSDFVTANAEHLPVPVLAMAQKSLDQLQDLDRREQARQAMQQFTTATQVLSDPTSPPASKLGAANALMRVLGPEKAAMMFPQILQMSGLVQEQAPKAYQAVKGERGELLRFDPNTGEFALKRDAQPAPFEPKTETGKIVADIQGLMNQGVPASSPIIGTLARQLERIGMGGMQSPLGKALEDQKGVIAEHGKGSLQAKAFGEYIQKLVGGETPSLGDIGGIRKEFATQSKDFLTIRDSYKRILSVGREISAAGDMALIFNYMKMLDPNSVVRETEYATAANAAGVPERIRAYWNRLMTGERLGPDQRVDFINRAHDLFDAQRGSQMALESEYKRIAGQSKVDPTLVAPDFIGDLRSFNARDKTTSTDDAVRLLKKGLGR